MRLFLICMALVSFQPMLGQEGLAFGMLPVRPDTVWAADADWAELIVRVERKEEHEVLEKPIIREMPFFQASFDDRGRPVVYRYFDLKGDGERVTYFTGWDDMRNVITEVIRDSTRIERWILEEGITKKAENISQKGPDGYWNYRYRKDGNLQRVVYYNEEEKKLLERQFVYDEEHRLAKVFHFTITGSASVCFFDYDGNKEYPAKVTYVDPNQFEVVRRDLRMDVDQAVLLKPEVFKKILGDAVFIGDYQFDKEGRKLRYFIRNRSFPAIATFQDEYDREGRLIRRSIDDDDDHLEIDFVYNEKGELVEEVHSERIYLMGEPLVGPSFRKSYAYDDQGRLMEMVFSRRRDKILFTETYTYEYR